MPGFQLSNKTFGNCQFIIVLPLLPFVSPSDKKRSEEETAEMDAKNKITRDMMVSNFSLIQELSNEQLEASKSLLLSKCFFKSDTMGSYFY